METTDFVSVIAPTVEAFTSALDGLEAANENRKVVVAARKAIDKAVDAVQDLPEEFATILTVNADIFASMVAIETPSADLSAMANKVRAWISLAADLGVDVTTQQALLERYAEVKPSTVRDGSSKTGSRALPGVLKLHFPDGKVRNSSGDWTSIRWEARDYANKANTAIEKKELDHVWTELSNAAKRGESGEWVVEDDLGNEYLIEYFA